VRRRRRPVGPGTALRARRAARAGSRRPDLRVHRIAAPRRTPSRGAPAATLADLDQPEAAGPPALQVLHHPLALGRRRERRRALERLPPGVLEDLVIAQ